MAKRRRRPWLLDEALTVYRHRGTSTAKEIAAMLPGRSVSAVVNCANKLIEIFGLPKLTRQLPPDTHDRIRELHARKMTDSEIGSVLKINRRYVAELRKSMGLPLHHDRLLEQRCKAVKAQWASLGIKNRAGLRVLSHRKYARDHGLPEQLRFRAVQVAYCLARHGPSTRRQICSRLGLKWVSVRKNGLCANGNWVKNKKRDQKATYLSELMDEGMVVKLNRALSTGRRGGNVSLYDLTPEWRERITNHVQKKQLASGTDGSAA